MLGMIASDKQKKMLSILMDESGELEEYLKVRDENPNIEMEKKLGTARVLLAIALTSIIRVEELGISQPLARHYKDFINDFLEEALEGVSENDAYERMIVSRFEKKSTEKRNERLVERVQEYIDSKCCSKEQCYAKVSEEMTAEGDPISPRTVKNIFLKMMK